MIFLILTLCVLANILVLNLLEKYLFNLNKIKKQKTEINYILDYIYTILNEDLKKPYIKIFILNISYENKDIELGITISEEGIAETLIGKSPFDLIKSKIKNLLIILRECSYDKCNITIKLLNEEDINETNRHMFRQIIPR